MTPWSMASRVRVGTVTLAAVQTSPATTPMMMPVRCGRIVAPRSRHPARRGLRAVVTVRG